MYRFKERDAPRFLGEPNDLLYYASSSSGPRGNFQDQFTDPEVILSKYYEDMARRGTSVYSPSEYGKERITWRSLGRERYNPCTHLRSRVVNLPVRLLYENYWTPNTVYLYRYYRYPGIPYYPYPLSMLQHPKIDYQAARARAWHNMQPRFEGKISLINFLFELKDFRDIAKHLFLRKDFLLHMRKSLCNVNKKRVPDARPHVPTSRKVTGVASTAVLLNNFMLQPLVKDVAKMCQQANIIVREAQQAFLESGSEFQKSHYTEELNRVDSRKLYPNNNYFWVGDGYLEFTKFTATLRYKYDYTMRNTIDAWMKYWGMRMTFEAFWNMIPFSFVADYFVQIGNSIRAMEHDPNVNLTDWEYGESLKTTFMYGGSTTGDPRFLAMVLDGNVYLKDRGDNLADKLLSGIEGTIYERRPCTPYYGPATPKLKLPSTTQTLNLCALLRCLL